MCLVIKDDIGFIATEDIVVYKVFEINRQHAMVSPFFGHCVWKPGVVKTEEVHESHPKPVRDYFYGKYLLGEGYFHSYALFSTARRTASTWTSMDKNRPVIWKCVIPKGTEYYKGWTNIGERSYASKALKPVEEIKN